MTRSASNAGTVEVGETTVDLVLSADDAMLVDALGTVRRRLQQFFEASVERTPDAVALQDGDVCLSYRLLEQRANQLAHYLRGHGVGHQTRVGILLQRSIHTYTALLGVLKSGAAFVPIDPACPPDRVAYIAADADLDLLLTTSDLTDAAPNDIRTSCLDQLQGAIDAQPGTRPVPEPDGDPICYVIYTSGSSGRPKGVAVAQSSICNFVRVAPAVYDIRPGDRVYQGMTISFDFSIEEIWPTWAVGATLVVGPTDSRRLGAELADFLDEANVSVLYCVPTLLATIGRDLPAVRTLIVGGEACPSGLVERWSRPGRRMLNTYGPTEATVTATWSELVAGKPVTIGRPMPTYSIVLLDEQRSAVPAGTVGEICIGGPGVALGYLGRPELTADRFIPHPLALDGGRLYRTGDLGRLDEHGEIVYLGRADSQVKIRGHRVDLGEIESVLIEDDGVAGAVAALIPVAGTEELVGYLIRGCGPDATATAADPELIGRLHEHLRRKLPDYMVPGYLDVLSALPTMPSGKVDRSRLPAPAGPRLRTWTGLVVPPATDLEEQIRTVWAETFGLEPVEVSVEADFFTDLAGHSLLAATAVSLLRERGIDGNPCLRDIYAAPTVRTLATRLATAPSPDRPVHAGPPRPPGLRPSSRRYRLAGVLQATFLCALLFVITLPVTAVYVANGGRVSPMTLVQLATAAIGTYQAVRWLLAPLLVRALTTGLRPGRYPLWSGRYLQLWAAQTCLSLTPLSVLSGSPLLPAYLRLLGARVGRRCHLATAMVSLPSMVRIGDDASIGYGAALRPWIAEDGWVVIEPVTIGNRAFVGAGAVLEPGAEVACDAVLGEQSIAGRGQRIPAGEQWHGSPSTPRDGTDPVLAELTTAPAPPGWTRPRLACAVAALVGLELLSMVMIAPAVLLVGCALLIYNQVTALLVATLAGPVFVLSVCLTIAAARGTVLPHTPVGRYPLRSGLGIRKWVTDKLQEASLALTNSLYATLYTVGWLRLLGARVGRGAEVSTVAHLDPDLLTLDRESFVADMASVGSAAFHNGWMSLRPTEVGRRAFVGNASVVPAGTRLGAGSLVGVLTVPPNDAVPAGTTWLGSPAIHLPVRQPSGDYPEELTFQPSRRRLLERLAIEFFRVTLPASMISVAGYLGLLVLFGAARSIGLVPIMLVAPLLALLTGLTVVFAVAAVKWAVVGIYRPRIEPLWSRFVRRTELVTGLYEAAAVPALLSSMVGTPFLPPLLRLFGARIGRRTWIGTTFLTEFDLVEVGDDATIGRGVSLQTHLFEDRVMKMSTVRIGDRATVGDRTVVLYDAVVGPGTALDPLSLVMKGEQLSPGARFRGIPAQTAA